MIGHNTPDDLVLTREQFRQQVIERMENSTDVLVGHTIEYLMDDDGVCNASIPEIMQCSKLKCRRAVMRSLTRICERIGLVKSKVNGRKNKYFIPQEIEQLVSFKGTGSKDTSALKPPPLKDTGDSKPVRLKDTGSHAYTRGRSLSENNINPPHSPPLNSNQDNSREKVCVLPEGFEDLGHGAMINCETIRHPDFSISIPSVQMQLELTPGCANEDARQHCKSFALQWAAEIESGKKPYAVIPRNISRAIAGSVTNKVRKQEQNEAERKRLSGSTRRVQRA